MCALIEPGATRENLYVAMTRGRQANTAYVSVNRPDDDHSKRHPGDPSEATARSVLYGVLQHVGAEPSAHQTSAGAAQQERWAALLLASGWSQRRVPLGGADRENLTVARTYLVEAETPALIIFTNIDRLDGAGVVKLESFFVALAASSRPVTVAPLRHRVEELPELVARSSLYRKIKSFGIDAA